MSRPKNADSAATQAQIIGAVFSSIESGASVAELSMRRVAQLAKLSLSTVQYYFGTRDELLEACLDDHYERLTTHVGGALEKLISADSDTALREAVREVTITTFRFAVVERGAVLLRQFLVAERGEIPSRRREQFQVPLLERASSLLCVRLGQDEVDLRMLMQTCVFAYAKYAGASDAEIAVVTGERTRERGLERVERHFAKMIERFVFNHDPGVDG